MALHGRLEAIPHFYMYRLEAIPEVVTAAADPTEPALLAWAASALAAAFTPHAALSSAAPHPLRSYRPFVNHYDDTASKLAELAKVTVASSG